LLGLSCSTRFLTFCLDTSGDKGLRLDCCCHTTFQLEHFPLATLRQPENCTIQHLPGAILRSASHHTSITLLRSTQHTPAIMRSTSTTPTLLALALFTSAVFAIQDWEPEHSMSSPSSPSSSSLPLPCLESNSSPHVLKLTFPPPHRIQLPPSRPRIPHRRPPPLRLHPVTPPCHTQQPSPIHT